MKSPELRAVALRLTQIVVGVAVTLLFSRGLIKQLDGYPRLVAATLLAQCFGYLMVWSNTMLLRATENLGSFRELKPRRIGHLILPLGSVAIGFGFYLKSPSFTFVGGCLFVAANYLLTKIEESPLLKMMREVELEDEKRRVRDMVITISTGQESQKHYVVDIKNVGRRTYKTLRVMYESILLDAANFGIDTTHMPGADAPGEPILVEALGPGHSVQFVRTGWGDHKSFSGNRRFVVELKFEPHESTVDLGAKSWSYVQVKLPNATRG